jgi:nucleoid-associated protein YgaU
MTNYAPPSWVPGTLRPNAPPPSRQPTRLPVRRTVTVPVTSTLHALALRYYGNPRRAVDLYNANRELLRNMDAPVAAGTTITLP